MESHEYKVKVLHDGDVSGAPVQGKRICVLGYGIQGHAQAQNWKDSGLDVVVGLREGGAGKSAEQARRDGMEVLPMAEAVRGADIVCILTPDMTHKSIYERFVGPQMKPGTTLYFSHGFSVIFKQIAPPAGVDVVMVAPKAPGKRVRETFKEGWGTPALVAVHQNATGKARDTALALAKAMGCTRPGVFECTFEQETLSDLFGEQAVLCGGVAELVKAGFETLVTRGYPPEIAYFECLHELKLITDLVQAGGIAHMYEQVSETARYGGWTRGTRVVTGETRKAMARLLDDIEDGTFAHEWILENQAGKPKFDMLRRKEEAHAIERVGAQIRTLFGKK